jgi:hypothetical protein
MRKPQNSYIFQTAFAVFLQLALSLPANADCKISALKWLAGTWYVNEADNIVEERWQVLPSAALIGSAWSAHQSRPTGSAEAETIVDIAGTVTLRLRHFDLALARASESADAPMTFTSASCVENKVVFDGQGDRTGEHITYIKSGDKLTFLGDFLHQGQPVHVEQGFVLANDPRPQP